MKFSKKLFVKIFILFVAFSVNAAPVVIKSRSAVATIVEGKAILTLKGSGDTLDLKKGDFISEGDKVRTGAGARVEIRLADKSLVRFDENTTFVLESAKVEEKKRKISIKLVLGKAWANVTGLFGKKKGGFALSSKTVVAGVRGTVYRMNVEKDYASVIKVYSGEVGVGKTKEKKKPTRLFAPVPVKGPHAVSMKEWVFIVKSMQKIVVSSDGRINKPTSFSENEDKSKWVKWNKGLDKKIVR